MRICINADQQIQHMIVRCTHHLHATKKGIVTRVERALAYEITQMRICGVVCAHCVEIYFRSYAANFSNGWSG